MVEYWSDGELATDFTDGYGSVKSVTNSLTHSIIPIPLRPGALPPFLIPNS